MVPTTATLDLSIWRNDDVYEYALRVIGPNLTGVSLRAQIRSERDVPGPARIGLETVTNGNAEGVRLASATFADGRWINDVRIRINKSSRQTLPYFGDFGDAAVLRWALAIGGKTRIDGRVFVLAHAMDSDNAPLDRTASFGLAGVQGGAPSSGATLTIAADSVAELVVDGADLVAAETVKAQTAATQSTSGADRSAREADRAALSASTALAAIGGIMYPTLAAGTAAVSATGPTNGYFAVAGDGTSTYAILYRKGVVFTPASLFAAGEQGAWYDPSDLASMFQDAAGTIAAAVDQPVGRILDKSGRGNHATQATAAARAILRTAGGLYWLEFDGSNDFLQTAAFALNATGTTATLTYSSRVTGSATGVMFELNSNYNSAPGALGAFVNDGAVGRTGAGVRGSVASAGCYLDQALNASAVVSHLYDTAAASAVDAVVSRLNGTQQAPVSPYGGAPGGQTFSLAYNLFIGARAGVSLPTGMRFYGAVLLGRKASAQEIKDSELWLATKAGLQSTGAFAGQTISPGVAEVARYASKAAYEGATGAALIGTKRGNLQKVLDRQPMFAGDYGVVGDGVTDDTVAAQAFIDACYAAGRRTANFGSMCCKISGPLYSQFVGIVFEPFGYGDSPTNSSGFYVVERPDGVPYTALTVTGFVADMNVSVFGGGSVQGDVNYNVIGDTRPRVNGVALGRPDGSGQLAASTVRGIRTYMLRGFGVKETNVFDTLIQNISIEYCGSEVEYAYSVQGDGNATGTVNESVHLRVQVEFAIYQAIYISPFTLSVGFLNIHSERAIAHPSYRTWFFGGSIKIQNIRLDALNRSKASIKFLSNQMSVEMLRADDIPCEIDPTGGVINMLNCAGRFIPTTASNGRVNFSGALGRFEQVKAGWVISGSAVSYLSVAEMGDEQFAVVRDSDVAVVESSATSTQGNLRVHGTSIASLTTSGMRSFKALDGSRCTLKGGVQQMSYQKITVDATSRLIGNVVLDSCGMRLDGVIQGDMNYQASRQALIGDRAVVTGGVANNGPPESGAYLDGLYDGMVTKNPKPIIGNPRGWMYAGGQWRSLGDL
jgi:hypothetical protein